MTGAATERSGLLTFERPSRGVGAERRHHPSNLHGPRRCEPRFPYAARPPARMAGGCAPPSAARIQTGARLRFRRPPAVPSSSSGTRPRRAADATARTHGVCRLHGSPDGLRCTALHDAERSRRPGVHATAQPHTLVILSPALAFSSEPGTYRRAAAGRISWWAPLLRPPLQVAPRCPPPSERVSRGRGVGCRSGNKSRPGRTCGIPVPPASPAGSLSVDRPRR